MKQFFVEPRRRLTFLIIGIVLISGCAPVLLVAVGAVGGYAVTRDSSVTLDLDRPADRVWTAVVEETKSEGQIKKEDKANRRLEAKVRRSDVVITMEQLTPSSVRVVIRARKHLLPHAETAQRLAIGIARRVG